MFRHESNKKNWVHLKILFVSNYLGCAWNLWLHQEFSSPSSQCNPWRWSWGTKLWKYMYICTSFCIWKNFVYDNLLLISGRCLEYDWIWLFEARYLIQLYRSLTFSRPLSLTNVFIYVYVVVNFLSWLNFVFLFFGGYGNVC